jgi:hypothetical protein
MKNQGILYISEAYNVRDTKVASKKDAHYSSPFKIFLGARHFSGN